MKISISNPLKFSRWFVPVLAPLIFLLQICFGYPGGYTFDSIDQLNQATTGMFNDWHPPLMAMSWRWLISITGNPASLFLLQSLCYWLGIGLISDGLIRAGRTRAGIIALFVGLFPFFLYVNNLITKDSEFGATLLLSFALVFWFKIQQRQVPRLALFSAVLIMLYAVLLRANSIFAIGALLMYFFSDQQRISFWKFCLVTLVSAVVALVFCGAMNKFVFAAKPTQPVRSLQIFDIVGIAKFSGDLSSASKLADITSEKIEQCYTPYWWDSVSPWGSCPELSERLMNKEYHKILSDRDIYPLSTQLTYIWLNSIVHHPVAYAEHRIKHFNAEINFLVPSLVRRYGKTWFKADAKEIKADYFRKNPATWPVIWFGVLMLMLVAIRSEEINVRTFSATLLGLSGLTYGLAYLVIGVASDSRYMYWMILAAVFSFIIVADRVWIRLVQKDKATWSVLILIVISLIGGLLARFNEWNFLLH